MIPEATQQCKKGSTFLARYFYGLCELLYFEIYLPTDMFPFLNSLDRL